MEQPKPDVYPNRTREWYDQIEAAHYSSIKHFRTSCLHARLHANLPKKISKEMIVGSAVDAAILEPEKMDEDFVQGPDLDRKTKKNREIHDSFAHRNSDKIVLSPQQMTDASCMRTSVWSNPMAHQLLTFPGGNNQVAIIWDDEISGIRCKGLIDRYTEDWDGVPSIMDLKTARDIDDHNFSRAIHKWGYHIQAGMYWRGINQLTKFKPRYYFVIVENHPPYDSRVLQFDPDSLEQGIKDAEDCLRRHNLATKKNEWPGMGNGFIKLPTYAMNLNELKF